MYSCWLSLLARLKVLSWLDLLQFHCYAQWPSLLLQEEEVMFFRWLVPRLLPCPLGFYVAVLWTPLLSKSFLNLGLRTKLCCVVFTGFLTSAVKNFLLDAGDCSSHGVIWRIAEQALSRCPVSHPLHGWLPWKSVAGTHPIWNLGHLWWLGRLCNSTDFPVMRARASSE